MMHHRRTLWKLIIMLKIYLFLLTCSMLTVLAKESYAQKVKISLEASDTPLGAVINEIKQQTEFEFAYDSELEAIKFKKVSIKASNENIEQVLNDVLMGTGVSYKIFDKIILLSKNEIATTSGSTSALQSIIITGTVNDSREPMPGVNVMIKGTTTGVVTDVDGKYSITVPSKDAILVFSFVGYKTHEFLVGDQKVIDIKLDEDTHAIEEVVVVGYGSMKKSDVTGSVVKADIESFRESPNVSIMQSLQGSIPGLNVGQVSQSGQNPDITIRGINTISGSTTPLIVVDGVIFRGNPIDLNPSDIESIDILKDASSTAIYGSEAANGVLMITTKSGKGYVGKPKITYSGSYSFQTPSHELVPLNREGYLKKMYDAFWEENRLAPDYIEPNPNWNVYSKFKSTESVEGYDDGTDMNWHDLLTDNGYIQSHSVSVLGGAEKINYFSSFGYTQQDGWLLNDDFERYNLRINLDSKITDWLTVGTQSFLSIMDYSGVSPSLGQIWWPPINKAYKNGVPVLEPTALGLNPVLLIQQDDVNKKLNLFGNVYADIKIPFIEGLSYRINYSRNYRHDRRYNFNEYDNNFQGSGYKNYDLINDWTFDNILTYNRSFFQHHTVNISLVYGRENRSSESTDAYSTIFINKVLGYNALEAGNASAQTTKSGAWEENSLYSMARLVYNYKKKYLFTGTIRRDGFSGFGENKKFGIFPSVAVGWVPSEEGFIKDNLPVLEYLKLRASYGTNGNRTVSRYQSLSKITQRQSYIYGDGGSAELGQYISSMANQDLGWETTTGLNLGLDFSILKRRIYGNIEYYNNNTKDLLYEIKIPEITGFPSISTNIGKLHNNGLEFSLSTVNIKNKDWEWETTFNFSRNRNRVVSILGIDENGDGKEDDLVASNIFIDEPLGVLYNYEIAGMYQLGDAIPNGFYAGNYKIADLNGDSKFSPENDRKILGYTDPGYRFSIQSKLVYKNWTLHIFINSIQGGSDYYYANGSPKSSWGNDVAEKFASGNSPTWDYWMPENPNAKHERLGYISSFKTILPVQRNFIRLQDISLSYTVPDRITKKLRIQGLKLFVSGKNLYTWTKWEGWDPETGAGIEVGRPVMTNYTLGLTLEL